MTHREGSAAAAVRRVRVLDVPAAEPLRRWRGVEVAHGGFGSEIALDPAGGGRFFLLADRGPNFDVPGRDAKGFARPDFTPRIGRFRIDGERIVAEGIVEVRDAAGRTVTGLPHPPGPGSTGESAVDLEGRALPLDASGLDPEGLVALPDGGFWLADEYAPALLRLDASARIVERVAPRGTDRRIPAVLARRRPNRGFEGLAMLPDGRTLAATLQSALDNPSAAVREHVTMTRLVLFDTADGRTRQYLYPQEAPALSNSAVAALSDTVLLVVEHDALRPGDAERPAWCKRIYRVDLADATDVTGDADRDDGLLVGGRTLEETAPAALAAAGIRPVRKTLLLDLLALGYPHDKPEGLALLDTRTLLIVNDDDFGIDGDDRGGIREKILPATGERDRNQLWIVELERGV